MMLVKRLKYGETEDYMVNHSGSPLGIDDSILVRAAIKIIPVDQSNGWW